MDNKQAEKAATEAAEHIINMWHDDYPPKYPENARQSRRHEILPIIPIIRRAIERSGMDVRPSREMCSECSEVSRVGFHVPDEIWAQVVPEGREQDIFCVRCFTRLADQKQVRWDDVIQFFPVSKVAHREVANSAYERIAELEREVELLRGRQGGSVNGEDQS